MYILDIIIILILIGMGIRGALKGAIGQIFGILSLICAVWISSRYAVQLSTWFSNLISYNAYPQAMRIIFFIVLFVIVIFVGMLIARLVETAIKLSLLGWLNRLLGIVISLITTVIVLGIILYFFNLINNSVEIISTEKLNSSKMYTLILRCTDTLFPYIKQIFK